MTFPSHRGSILDRAPLKTQNYPLSEIQSEMDHLVSNGLAVVSDEKMMASLFAAGAAGRFIRLGTMAASGKSLAPWAVQGFSHATALAGESAFFAGTERKFAEWEGHAPTRSFQKDWARAAINLGSIKFLGGAGRGQNLITQHLLIDAGMVGRPSPWIRLWGHGKAPRKPGPTDDPCRGDEFGNEGILSPSPWVLAQAFRHGEVGGSGSQISRDGAFLAKSIDSLFLSAGHGR